MDQWKCSVGAGLEVGLRRALFDGTTPASLRSLALQSMARTGGKSSVYSLDPFRFNCKAATLYVRMYMFDV